jgi:hypothetical protein
MTWVELHRASEEAAIQAEARARAGDGPQARVLYARAAVLEHQALGVVDPLKARTRAVTAVSAVALFYKAAEYARAEQLAHSLLADPETPEFARRDLRDLVQALWTESSKESTSARFLPGQVIVSLRGGIIATGGAPLDLVAERVQTVQAMIHRTVEFVRGMAFRPRGAASAEIQELCRPWLFQAPPGSYQFAVVIREPDQLHIFENGGAPGQVWRQFLEIVKAADTPDFGCLEELVPPTDYRKAFLRLTRNLAPVGEEFDAIEFRLPAGGGVSLGESTRTVINSALKRLRSPPQDPEQPATEEHVGILRAVDLEKDRLVVVPDHAAPVHLVGLEDALDDVVGPMVNKRVKVTAHRPAKGDLRLIDIEMD